MYNYDLKGKNKYYTLYSCVRDDILRGKIKAGERLPSKRAFAAELGVSVVTVQLAYDQLLAEGYIRSKERSGFYAEKVAEGLKEERKAASNYTEIEQEENFKIDLVHGNTPPNMFPFSVWARLIRSVLSDCGEHLLERVPCDGDKGLKSAVAAYLYRSRGIDVDPRYIVVGAGAEHLYGVIVQLLGRDKLYAVENPGYGKISSTYALNGARCLPVGVTDTGIDVSVLEKSEAHVAHVSPSHQFPTGAVMPVSARSRLIEWAKRSGGYVIEDEYDSEFRLTGKPLQCMCGLCPEKVIYMNTFSKSLAPSMRMGYMVLPPALYDRFLQIFSSSASFVPLFEQKALAKMLDGGYFERHLNRLKNYYRTVHGALLKKLASLPERCEVLDTGSGLHVIAKFPDAQSDGQIKSVAAARGIKIKCLSDYLLAPMAGVEGCAVINYSGLTPEILSQI
ncbi:MAG: PLP-dependent aminotransferase family protein [Clostridia bacterium]|nr:PLP-dependent aminotransferase family protein [Clostridia bacterium]